jgi:hypothetical protein
MGVKVVWQPRHWNSREAEEDLKFPKGGGTRAASWVRADNTKHSPGIVDPLLQFHARGCPSAWHERAFVIVLGSQSQGEDGVDSMPTTCSSHH